MREEQVPIPPGVDRALRAAAEAAPGYPANLVVVLRRGRRRRRNKAGLLGVAVLATLLVTFGVPVTLTRGGQRPVGAANSASPAPSGVAGASAGPGVAGTSGSPAPAGSQRMFLHDPGLEGYSVVPLCGVVEVVGNTAVTHPVPPATTNSVCAGVSTAGGHESVIISGQSADGAALPDGGLVAYTPVNGVVVYDGTVTDELGLLGDEHFVGVDGWNLYTVKDGGLVRYAYPPEGVPGDARGFVPHPVGATGLAPSFEAVPGTNADVAAGRVVLATRDCGLRVLDATGHQARVDVPLEPSGCTVQALRVSPDGRRAAVQYSRAAAPRLAVYDLASGRVLVDAAIPQAGLKPGGFIPGSAGLAWSNATTVRVNWVQLPADAVAHHYYPLATVLRGFTRPIA